MHLVQNDQICGQFFEPLYMDLIGPMPTEPCSHARYILTFIDDYTGFALLSFLWVKLDYLSNFCNMVSQAETFTGNTLASMRSDQEVNLQDGSSKHSSLPKVSLIRLLFLRLLNRIDMLRCLIGPYWKRQKQCTNMPAYLKHSGKTLQRLHYIFITDNPCVIMNG